MDGIFASYVLMVTLMVLIIVAVIVYASGLAIHSTVLPHAIADTSSSATGAVPAPVATPCANLPIEGKRSPKGRESGTESSC